MASEVFCNIRRYTEGRVNQLLEHLSGFSRRCFFRVISVAPVPNHLAFIMDGNRRYAKKHGMEVGWGHKAGFSALMSILRYCYELGIKYVTIYAFSIDNFKRRPEEVQSLMELMLEKIESLLEKESIAQQYGMRVYFIGNLSFLSDPVRSAAEKVTKATAKNSRVVLLVCVAYTSTDEIVHAVEESCLSKLDDIQATVSHSHSNGLAKLERGEDTSEVNRTNMENCNNMITLVDIERNMRMAVAPDPDILIRSSGEMRLSNFLLWQTSHCPLYSPGALWPEIGLWHLVWAILIFQRSHSYLEEKKKKKQT